MKIKGIIYDCGLEYWPGQKIREIPPQQMKEEFSLIKNELKCNAVGLHGCFNDKLLQAAEIALKEGLAVWLFPRYINKNLLETISLFQKLAENAENLRKEWGNVVLSAGGVELSVNCTEFFSGRIYVDRVRRLSCYCRLATIYLLIMGEEASEWFFKFRDKELKMKVLFESFVEKGKIEELEGLGKSIEAWIKSWDENFRSGLQKLVEIGRKNFKGEITYGAGCWEPVDWSAFDLIGINLYLDRDNWFVYEDILRSLKRIGKPVIVTEFGAATFKYSSMWGGGAWSIFDKFEVERSEEEQAKHIKKQFELIKKAGVDGAFVFIFTDVPEKIHVENPTHYKEDLDRSGYGIMKILPSGEIKPKKAFFVVKEMYSKI